MIHGDVVAFREVGGHMETMYCLCKLLQTVYLKLYAYKNKQNNYT